MQLQERFGDQVAAISLNVDYTGEAGGPSDELQSKILGLLTDLGISCENLISSEPSDEVLKEFDIFGLPALLIYNPQGQLHKRFEGSFDYQTDVFPEVEKLITSG